MTLRTSRQRLGLDLLIHCRSMVFLVVAQSSFSQWALSGILPCSCLSSNSLRICRSTQWPFLLSLSRLKHNPSPNGLQCRQIVLWPLEPPCPNAIFLVFDRLINSAANRSRSTVSKMSWWAWRVIKFSTIKTRGNCIGMQHVPVCCIEAQCELDPCFGVTVTSSLTDS